MRREQKSRTPPPINGYRNRLGQASPKKRKRSPQTDEEEDVVEITASQLEKSNLTGKSGHVMTYCAPCTPASIDKGKQSERRFSRYFSPPSSASSSNCMLSFSFSIYILLSIPPLAPEEPTCPMCGKNVPMKTINEHIDSRCTKYCSSDKKSKQKQKDGWGKVFGNTSTNADAGPSKGKPRYAVCELSQPCSG